MDCAASRIHAGEEQCHVVRRSGKENEQYSDIGVDGCVANWERNLGVRCLANRRCVCLRWALGVMSCIVESRDTVLWWSPAAGGFSTVRACGVRRVSIGVDVFMVAAIGATFILFVLLHTHIIMCACAGV
eukprot:Opistho-2@49324